MIATLVLTVALAQQQTISFTHPCANSAVVLEALGKQLGVTMRPSGSVTKDYFLVSFHDVPVSEALKRLASSLHATWMQERDVRYLTRTHAQELQEDQEVREESVRHVQEWLDKHHVKAEWSLDSARALIEEELSIANSKDTVPDAYNRLHALDKQSSSYRYLYRLLLSIGAERLADAQEGQPVEYVESPTSRQRLLPARPTELFRAEDDLYVEALSRSGALDRLAPNTAYTSLFSPYDLDNERNTATKLTVSRNASNITFELAIGGHGKVREVIAESFLADPLPKELLQQQGSYTPTTVETEMGATADLSTFWNKAPANVSGETIEALRDPVAHDPLADYGANWILQAANGLGKNVVGVLPDDLSLSTLFSVQGKRLNYSALWSSLRISMTSRCEVGVDGDWISIYPSRPRDVREARLDRVAWKGLIKRGKVGGEASLEDYAAYAALSDDDSSVLLAMFSPHDLGQGFVIEYPQQTDWLDALRLYGRVTRAQQVAARNGGVELLVTGMRNELWEPARRLLGQPFTVLTSQKMPHAWEEPLMRLSGPGDHGPIGLVASDPPPRSVVRIFKLTGKVVCQKRDNGLQYKGTSPDMMGMELAFQSLRPENAVGRQPYFAVSLAEQLLIEFEFPGAGYVYKRIQIDHVGSDLKYVPLDNLPDDVRETIQKAFEKYKKRYAHPGGGGS
ncbi:MAG TPA: hypothetical protein VNI20_01620 [Fimbriimonadaceae bacterium]|nr:hypothetical protein [Fimbriimonadaceae bacterium]